MDSFIMDMTANILSPPIIKIGNKLYRKNPSRASDSSTVPVGHLEEDVEACDDALDTEIDPSQTCYIIDGIKSDSEGYRAEIYVPPIFYPFVVGSGQSKKRDLESTFSCRLTIPSLQSTLPNIKILSKSEANIYGAARRIAWIVSQSRPNMKPTHFVCLPVNNDKVKKSYLAFKSEFLGNDFRGIDEDLFVSENKLHFTLATLFLADQREVKLASQLLVSFMDTKEGEAFDRSPLCLTIRGLDCMNDDPRCVRVLYMSLQKNEGSRRLQALANGLADMFTRHGLHSGHRHLGDSVKLHMTVLNSRLRAQRQASRLTTEASGVSPSDRCSSETFSAVAALLAFETYQLIEKLVFDEILLCKMIADDAEDNDGSSFYPCIAKLTWTTS